MFDYRTISSPEEVDLQILGKDGEESQVAKYSERQEPLERQPDAVDKGAASQQTTSLRKKISLTVLTLLSYTSTFAAIADVISFYAIVVSESICMCACVCDG